MFILLNARSNISSWISSENAPAWIVVIPSDLSCKDFRDERPVHMPCLIIVIVPKSILRYLSPNKVWKTPFGIWVILKLENSSSFRYFRLCHHSCFNSVMKFLDMINFFRPLVSENAPVSNIIMGFPDMSNSLRETSPWNVEFVIAIMWLYSMFSTLRSFKSPKAKSSISWMLQPRSLSLLREVKPENRPLEITSILLSSNASLLKFVSLEKLHHWDVPARGCRPPVMWHLAQLGPLLGSNSLLHKYPWIWLPYHGHQPSEKEPLQAKMHKTKITLSGRNR